MKISSLMHLNNKELASRVRFHIGQFLSPARLAAAIRELRSETTSGHLDVSSGYSAKLLNHSTLSLLSTQDTPDAAQAARSASSFSA